MSALTDQLRRIDIRGALQFYVGDDAAGQVHIYRHVKYPRDTIPAAWVVRRSGHNLSDARDYYHGGKAFSYSDKASADASLQKAKEWAAQEFDITEWKRDPFGDYGDKEYVTIRTTELKQQLKEAGITGKELNVYAWRGYRPSMRSDTNRSGQTNEVMAAPSKAAVKRACGITDAANISITGNQAAIEVALANPGKLMVRPLNGRGDIQYVEVPLS